MSERLSLAQLEAFDPHAPRGGRERRFCCPFCGDGKPKDSAHRCLSLNTQSGAWICQRSPCHACGKLADFCEERSYLNRRDFARQQLRRVTALQPKAQFVAPDDEMQAKNNQLMAQLESARSLRGTAGEEYLQGRGVSVEVAEAAGVQFCPDWMKSDKWRGCAAVVFPICNRPGDLVAAQGREIGGVGKFSLGPKSQGVFATAGGRDGKRLVIVEAPIDALSLAVAGFPAIALCGTSGPVWLPNFCYRRRVLLAFDADEPNAEGKRAGDDAATTLTPKLESFGATVTRLRPENGKDWNEILKVHGKDEIKRQIAALTWAEVQARSARYWKSK